MKTQRLVDIPFAKLAVRIVIHETDEELVKAYQDDEVRDANVMAFCDPLVDRSENDPVFAELHFSLDYFDPATVMHEVIHAMARLAKVMHLKASHEGVEELLAQAAEHVFEETLKFKRGCSTSRRPRAQHPPNCGLSCD